MCLVLLFGGCGPAAQQEEAASSATTAGQSVAAAPPATGCRSCHPEVELDPSHDLGCTTCHQGDPLEASPEGAHRGLVARPAHPRHWRQTCGGCHPEETDGVEHAGHTTLAGEINGVRQAFGLPPVDGVVALPPAPPSPADLGDLAMDMLRRRCLRCHLWSNGEPYDETRHGTGCGACHLAYGDGGLLSHRFQKDTGDRQCRHCHYSNFVGADYQGRFQRDFNLEYRTPFQADGFSRRPYGVEEHRLVPDVHQRAGMTCLDCHDGRALMGLASSRPPVSCRGCHDPAAAADPRLVMAGGGRRLPIRSGRVLAVPVMTHPAHQRYGGTVACGVCHAQWGFADRGPELLRLDVVDFDPWSDLAYQGSAELEEQMEQVLYGEAELEAPFMSDGITGERSLGVWIMAYERRRWEDLLVCRDDQGGLRVCRELVGLRLSWVDGDGEVVVDGETAPASRLLPYTPHTMGKAGSFFQRRLEGR